MKCYSSVTMQEVENRPAAAGQSKTVNIPLRILVTVKKRFGNRYYYVLRRGRLLRMTAGWLFTATCLSIHWQGLEPVRVSSTVKPYPARERASSSR